jgi:hypothetical protein
LSRRRASKYRYQDFDERVPDAAMNKHRRDMLLQAYLPLGGIVATMAVVLIVMLLAMTTNRTEQVGTTAACMSALIMLPMALVCIIPYALIVATAAGVGKLNAFLPVPLARARNVMRTVSRASYGLSRRVAAPVIWLNTRFAMLESLFEKFEQYMKRRSETHLLEGGGDD